MKTDTRRGFSSFSALMVILALGILVSVTMRARTRDLAFEDRTLCRVRARWAAESAVARMRAAVPGGGRLSGTLEGGVSYRVSAVRAPDGTLALEAIGRCEVTRPVEVRIEATLARGGRTVLDWEEGPVSDEPVAP